LVFVLMVSASLSSERAHLAIGQVAGGGDIPASVCGLDEDDEQVPTGLGAPLDEGGPLRPGVLPLGPDVGDLLNFKRRDVVLGDVRLALVTPGQLSPHCSTLGLVLH